ncbi:hypothetical protein, partial [Stenotrophomonas sp. 3diitr2024]|uniref:hypothetical protein n=1 Tax=Stenotrophomonas sp. 3diitr2024 TaxID=3345115 RepID=UPI0035CAD976
GIMTEEERLSVSTHLSGHLAMGVELTIPKPLQRTTTVPNFFADAVAAMAAPGCAGPWQGHERAGAAERADAVLFDQAQRYRVDRVELNQDGSMARAVQANALHDESALNRNTAPVSTA